MKRRRTSPAGVIGVAGDLDHAYLVLLRRELTRSQARLKRAEWERDQLRAQVEKLRRRATAASKGKPRKNPTASR